jgi:hypothetical protein
LAGSLAGFSAVLWLFFKTVSCCRALTA